jgi:hypothetical protein
MSFMSSVGSFFAERGVQAIAAGLLSGAVAGTTLVATGVVPVGGTAAASTIELLACPGSGPVLANVANGQSLLVTGRSFDGAWLEVYIGEPGIERGWAPTTALRVDASAADLPVGACVGPTPAPLRSPAPIATVVIATASPEPAPSAPPSGVPPASASPAPSASPSPTPRITVKPTGTPKPTPTPTASPSPTPSPTPFIDVTPPSLSALIVTSPAQGGNGKYAVFGPGCPFGPYSATIRVTATDPDDEVSAITLSYWPGGSGVLTVQMTRIGATNNWQGTINAQDSWTAGEPPGPPDGTINYWVQAVDSHSNTSAILNHSNSYILYKEICLI